MIEIISSINRHLYTKTLDGMFEHRYRILIKGLGWKVPEQFSNRDQDAYDTDDTVYLVDTDSNGQLLASVRLNPTTKPHLMSDIFASHCDLLGVPRSDDIWELSRAVYDFEKMDGTRFRFSRAAMRLAIVEFCQSVGIAKVSWLTKRDLFATISSFWPTKPLGGSTYCPEDDETYVAALSTLNATAWDRSSAKFHEISEHGLELAGYLPASAWASQAKHSHITR